jgi:amino acid transporter
MVQVPTDISQAELVRAIGRWSMVALAVNSIVGSGIFGLPSPVAGLVGHASPLAVLLAAPTCTCAVPSDGWWACRLSGSPSSAGWQR